MGRNLLDGLAPPVVNSLSTWQPAPGDGIEGRLCGYEKRVTKYGEARVAVLEVAAGERIGVWVTPTVLKKLFQEQKPSAGDWVAIKFWGAAEGKQYHLYSMAVEKVQKPARDEQWQDDGDPFDE